MMFGGALVGGKIAQEQLFNLKVVDNEAIWSEIKVNGDRPGPRYGHSLTFAKPNLILFGGSNGSDTMNDTWCLNIANNLFQWTKLDISGLIPSPRVYHSADLCQFGGANGMIIIFGGRNAQAQTLNEVWGLRRHRDGKWDWTRPPEKTDQVAQLDRYQHRSIFYGSLMFNVGGKINDSICNNFISVYDYEHNKWYTANGPECFRHVCWIYKDKLYVHGGLDNKNKILGKGAIQQYLMTDIFKDYPELVKKIISFQDLFSQTYSTLSTRSNSNTSGTSGIASPNIPGVGPEKVASNVPRMTGTLANTIGQTQVQPMPEPPKPKGKIAPQEEIMVILPKNQKNQQKKNNQNNDISNYFIEHLLRPKTFANLAPDAEFPFKPEEIIELCNQAQTVIESQSMLVHVGAPAKVFGDIHGQYSDLMRFFDLWGAPCNPEEGKINIEDDYNYVFLGDYVDRGNHSLETICLLLALKVKFPEKIVLLRGNHEDRWINQSFGFYDECENRLQDNPDLPDSVFNRINNLFEYFPLGCVIQGLILCLHGGIGSSLKKLEQIESIQRPLEVIHEVQTPLEKLVVDILWSDPTDSDNDLGIQANSVRDPHGTGNIVKFGPDVVKDFLQKNGLDKIIRAHECVMDGFERFAGGDLITVFSATDYCGKHKNAGAILIITRSFGINPKLIYPNLQQANWIEQDESGYRPPTPPRWAGTPQGNY
jgi:diadenosine tetraphosphatase ApaH/serine/threonine PP2A family protein phosphatase